MSDRILSRLFVALLLFAAGYATKTWLDSEPRQLQADGNYSVLFVRKMFDSQSRPTYYILAAPCIKRDGHVFTTDNYRLYEVPRGKILNIESDSRPDDRPIMLLHMTNGNGALLTVESGPV